MFKLSSWHYFIVLIFCAALLGTALYMQHYMGLDPCPLCALTRLAVLVFGALALLAIILRASILRRLISMLMIVTSMVGFGISARHVWLQNLPPEKVPSCGPGLNYIMDAFPLFEALKKVFSGSGECAEVSWRFIGLSIPGWMLIIFVLFFVFSVFSFVKSKKRKRNYFD